MKIPSWVRVGTKVVCVKTSFKQIGEVNPGEATVVGEVYTIVHTEIVIVEGPRLLLWLAERPKDCAYQWRLFRPAVPHKTEAEDLAKFKDLLTSNERLDLLAERLDEQWVGMPDLNHVPEA